MADLLDDRLVDAAPALLRADAGLTVCPDEDGVTPLDPGTRYVRWYAHVERPPDMAGNSLAATSAMWRVRWWIHCIAENEYAAVALSMRVRAALLDVRPAVTGRECGLIRHEASQPPRRDEDSGVVLFDLTEVYRLDSTPA